LDHPYLKGGKAQLGWNARGLRSAVSLQGTINQPGDQDSCWTVEMAIPFADLDMNAHKDLPRKAQQWRLNFQE